MRSPYAVQAAKITVKRPMARWERDIVGGGRGRPLLE
jgi:hypothetical protein